jgi:hypothetical protein
MGAQTIRSREYKLMMKTAPFAAAVEAEDLKAVADRFWRVFAALCQPLGVECRGSLDEWLANRRLRFIDTPERALWQSGYALRERWGENGGERRVTMKYRHPDRYSAGGRPVRAKRGKRRQEKFEEDLKAPFLSHYSHSCTVTIPRPWRLDPFGRVEEIFPWLRLEGPGVTRSSPLATVGDRAFRERVLGGADVDFGKDGKAEAAMIFWFDGGPSPEGGRQEKAPDDAGDAVVRPASDGEPANDFEGSPVAVEFSFRYGHEKGRFRAKAAERAFLCFNALQQLEAWVDLSGPSKTEIAFS